MKTVAIFIGVVAIAAAVVYMVANPEAEAKEIAVLIGLGGFVLTLIGFLIKKS